MDVCRGMRVAVRQPQARQKTAILIMGPAFFPTGKLGGGYGGAPGGDVFDYVGSTPTRIPVGWGDVHVGAPAKTCDGPGRAEKSSTGPRDDRATKRNPFAAPGHMAPLLPKRDKLGVLRCYRSRGGSAGKKTVSFRRNCSSQNVRGCGTGCGGTMPNRVYTSDALKTGLTQPTIFGGSLFIPMLLPYSHTGKNRGPQKSAPADRAGKTFTGGQNFNHRGGGDGTAVLAGAGGGGKEFTYELAGDSGQKEDNCPKCFRGPQKSGGFAFGEVRSLFFFSRHKKNNRVFPSEKKTLSPLKLFKLGQQLSTWGGEHPPLRRVKKKTLGGSVFKLVAFKSGWGRLGRGVHWPPQARAGKGPLDFTGGRDDSGSELNPGLFFF